MNAIFALLVFTFLANMQGTWSWMHLVALAVCMFAMFTLYLLLFQESVLYVPEPVRGMRTPSDNPRGVRSPMDKGMTFEDVYLKTADGETLHAWFIPAGMDSSRLPYSEHRVTLQRREGEALGLNLHNELLKDGQIVVSTLEEEGVVACWNSSNPSKAIRGRDVIIEVNGVTGTAQKVLEEVSKKSAASVTITLRRPKTPTLLFCHENAGNIGFRIPNFLQIQDHLQANVLALDYRGYGHSTGKPSEDGLIEDALCAWRWMQKEAEAGRLDGDRLFVYGRSLGGAVSVAMASTLQKQGLPGPQGLILENTFVSISALVDTMFPFLAWPKIKERLLRLRWESGERIKDLTLPLLFLAGEKDEMIPPVQMRQLISLAQAARIRRTASFPDGSHNDTWERGGAEYWEVQAKFVRECCGETWTGKD